jgi:hypothetical protein
MNLQKLFTILFLTNTLFLSAQKKCDYTLNKEDIIQNKNLDKFIFKLEKERFIVLNDKKKIPVFIERQLDCMTNDFSIANPTEKYQSNCVAKSSLPKRKLLFLSKSKNTFVMTYLTSGFAVSTQILLIEFDNEKILDLWSGTCLKKLKSNVEIIKYIQESRKNGLALNTKSINF